MLSRTAADGAEQTFIDVTSMSCGILALFRQNDVFCACRAGAGLGGLIAAIYPGQNQLLFIDLDQILFARLSGKTSANLRPRRSLTAPLTFDRAWRWPGRSAAMRSRMIEQSSRRLARIILYSRSHFCAHASFALTSVKLTLHSWSHPPGSYFTLLRLRQPRDAFSSAFVTLAGQSDGGRAGAYPDARS